MSQADVTCIKKGYIYYVETHLFKNRDIEAHFHKGKVFVHVDLNCQYRVAGCRGQARLLHLLVKEIDNQIFRDTKWYVPNVQSVGVMSGYLLLSM